jgi:hypothetical protein
VERSLLVAELSGSSRGGHLEAAAVIDGAAALRGNVLLVVLQRRFLPVGVVSRQHQASAVTSHSLSAN